MLNSLMKYGTYIAYGAIVAAVGLILRFTYNAGYEACEAEFMRSVNEALIEDKAEADNVRLVEQRLDSDAIDSGLASLGILRD